MAAISSDVPSRDKWRDLALGAIDCIHDAERETSWGSATFGPSVWERLRDEQNDLLSADRAALEGVTRTVTIDNLTPQELARLFTAMNGEQQAAFFSEVWRIAKDWPGTGWCGQSYAIVQKADRDAQDALRTLAGHVQAEFGA